ncbi:hypothetical protein AVEN_182558-1, partial [Araneus ventricosus]
PTEVQLVTKIEGRGGLVVRSRPCGRRVPGSKPDSSEDPFVYRTCCALNHTQGVKCPSVGVLRKFGEGIASPGVVLVI